ncbi:MAG: transglutaminase-like domain-containing protein [Euryarchaeota archaeon]|nr:transglutaminase-like domain-containing protein [Euryarchaeota archaeon]
MGSKIKKLTPFIFALDIVLISFAAIALSALSKGLPSYNDWVYSELNQACNGGYWVFNITPQYLTARFSTAQDVFNYVHLNVAYESDEKVWNQPEYWGRANETWKKGKGDCEDKAILLTSLIISSTLERRTSRVVVGSISTGGHTWSEVYNITRQNWDVWDVTNGIQVNWTNYKATLCANATIAFNRTSYERSHTVMY